VCRELRTFSQVPVIFLTARNDEFDRVLGLELGADDYVTKPFSPRELVARVRARLRRSVPAPSTPASAGWKVHGAFAIDGEGRRIRYRDTPLDLTRYEYALLAALLARPGSILSRSQLMERGWDHASDSADRTIDTHVKTLRAKLRAAGAQDDPIRTHRGVGYALEI
jgi:two-component system catabolic regulation response regulator CreB